MSALSGVHLSDFSDVIGQPRLLWLWTVNIGDQETPAQRSLELRIRIKLAHEISLSVKEWNRVLVGKFLVRLFGENAAWCPR